MTTDGEHPVAELACVPLVAREVADAAEQLGLRPVGHDARALLQRLGEPAPVAAIVVDAADSPLADALAVCTSLPRRDACCPPVLVRVSPGTLDELPRGDDLFDEFVVTSGEPRELAVRLGRLVAPLPARDASPSLLVRGALEINLATYRAAVAGRVLDLTYMEYELLRFLVVHPDEVVTRETLLNRVWGYEYYGGARTVDVHVRRLRAKLGEEHAHLIHTVRGVGYRFA